MSQPLRLIRDPAALARDDPGGRLDAVFAALSDPVRRTILTRLDGKALLVSELAREFDISLQAVSKHIQVLVRAGLIEQERTGRISRCSLLTGPIYEAAVWLNRYSKYWQDQFDLLAATLHELGPRRRSKAPKRARQGSGKREKRQER
jgi:DNA-binding transcriptional ArsR family regulator